VTVDVAVVEAVDVVVEVRVSVTVVVVEAVDVVVKVLV